ncbi:ankyrin repeat-containing domain protein [Mycena epipterygia]|nr:ankyrin repeat-containing domain protein [Mycena epipterygia]
MSTFPPPCISSDPDISGIGVRVAIYAQNLLSFIPAVWALWDGKISDAELDSVETQSTTILITAFAILISAMVEARTVGLTNYHASIVLNLSWMNNTNTFIYFLLYVHHKSRAEEGRIDDLASWIKHLWKKASIVPNGSGDIQKPQGIDDWHCVSFSESDVDLAEKIDDHIAGATVAQPRSSIRRIFKRIVLVLGSLHLTLMAALGIWLWSNPRSFGTASSCAVDRAFIIIVGQRVPLGSPELREWSLVIYSLFLAPGLNLILPMALFLGLFLGYQAWHKRLNADDQNDTPSVVPIFLGLGLLFAINVIFVADIELTLRQNRSLQTSAESAWTFGQILAILLLVLPLRDLVESRDEKKRIRQYTQLLQDVMEKRIKQLTSSLRNGIKEKATPETILALLKNGADINTTVEDSEFATVLQLSSSRPDSKFVAALLKDGAALDIEGGQYGTALQAALHFQRLEIFKILLAHGADPNIQGGEYGTALQAAAYLGNLEIFHLLLDKGANPNLQGGEYGTALQAAVVAEKEDIVKVLLESGADPNIKGGQYRTALGAAVYFDRLGITSLLLENGADPNAEVSEQTTVLQLASYWGKTEIVQLLLDKGADPNIQGGELGTALHAASKEGHKEIVRLLLDKGVDPNIEGGIGKTPLQLAESPWISWTQEAYDDIVKLLLERGAKLRAPDYIFKSSSYDDLF